MTRMLTTAPGDSDRANIRVFLIAFVVMASGLWIVDHVGASSATGEGVAREALASEATEF